MPKQPDLAKAAALSLRTVVAVETGEKVSNRTYRKIEAAIGLPTGIIDDFLVGIVSTLPSPGPGVDAGSAPPAPVKASTTTEYSAEQRARWRSMTIDEIFERGREIREMFNADEQLRYLNAALGEKERQRSEAESTEDSPL